MKIKRKIPILLVSLMLLLTGCGTDALQDQIKMAQSENKEIHLSIEGNTKTKEKSNLNWIELDQLNSFKNIRKEWDNSLNIVNFDTSSKNGVMFIDLEGNWAGNNTLFNVFQNKAFYEFWGDGTIKSDLAQSAMNEFSDITNESTGIYASVNAYFNIIPQNDDKTSGLMDTLNRAEAMSAISRGDTPVIYDEVNEEFENAVGYNIYNSYAVHAVDSDYLDYRNGSLCYDTYNSPITRAEVIYMLIQRHFKDEYDNTNVSSTPFTDCSNAGDVANKLGIKEEHAWQAYELEYCLQTSENDCPESLYKSLVVAYNHGIIGSETEWKSTISGGSLIKLMLSTYEAVYNTNGFSVNASTGQNAGQSLIVTEDEDVISDSDSSSDENNTSQEIGTTIVAQVRDVTNLDDLFKIYGDEINMTDEEKAEAYEIASNWEFEAADTWMEVAHCNYLNVRTGPSTDYEILKSIPSGTKCHIVAVCKENGWYRIIADNKVVYQCGVYFKEFEGSDEYLIKTGEKANNF